MARLVALWVPVSTFGQAPTGVSLNPSSLTENAAAETVIGTLSAQDPDPGDTHSFSLPLGWSENKFFQIVNGNQLAIAQQIPGQPRTPDFEQSDGTFQVRVSVEDSVGNPGEFLVTGTLIDDRTEDADGDGLSEAEEEDTYDSSDVQWDKDGDGYGDGWEVRYGGDLNDPLKKPERAIVPWGDNSLGQGQSPAGIYSAISAGGEHSLALRADGTVVGWGNTVDGATVPPAGLSGVVAVAAGETHSLALKADGTVVGWGENDQGQIDVPAELSSGGVVAVAAGYGEQSLALKRDGTLVAWGDDRNGQATGRWDSPRVWDLSDVVQVAGGGLFSMALRADGTVVTWGDLGDEYELKAPEGLDHVVAIAAGYDHALALRADGTVVTWGYPWVQDKPPPAGLSNVVAIAAGSGFSLALKADGTVEGWGEIRDVQTSQFIAAANPPAGLANVGAITAGASHALAMFGPGQRPRIDPGAQITGTLNQPVTAQGIATTGGSPTLFAAVGLPAGLSLDPASGMITGTPTEAGRYFVRVNASNETGADSRVILVNIADGNSPTGIALTPDQLPENAPAGAVIGTLAAQDADLGDAHVFSLPLGWSENHFYRLANGNQLVVADQPPGEARTPDFEQNGETFRVRVRVVDNAGNTGEFWIAGTLLDDRTEDVDGDGLTEAEEEDIYGSSDLQWDKDGDGYGDGWEARYGGDLNDPSKKPLRAIVAWGDNSLGQWQSPAARYTSISAGGEHSLALRTDGTVAGWGNAVDGATRPPPDLTDVVAVAAGETQSLALKGDGTVMAWGENDQGQIDVPAELSSGGVVAVAAGYGEQSLALKRDGTVVGWGDNGAGQIDVPEDLTDVVAIAGGWDFSMALRADGTVVTWGDLGDLQELRPPDGLDQVIAIAAGVDHALALREDGTVVSWGHSWVQSLPPGLSNVVAIAAGSGFSLALKSDGKVVGWGAIHDTHYLQIIGDGNPPAGVDGVVAVSAGGFHALAMTAPGQIPRIDPHAQVAGTLSQPIAPQSIGTTGGNPTRFVAVGLPAGLSIDSITGTIAGTPSEAGRFLVRIVASNDTGSDSRVILVNIAEGNPPTGVTLSPGQLLENATTGTAIGSLLVQDADPVDTHTFSLVLGWSENKFYRIASGNQLEVADQVPGNPRTPDFALRGGTFQVRVRVQDSMGNTGEFWVTGTLINDRTEDADGDGLTEAEEEDSYGSSDLQWDKDGDGYGDGWEVRFGGDLNDPLKKPQRAIVAWGDDSLNQGKSPAGVCSAISAGGLHSLALLADGTVVGWGSPADGATVPPPGLTDAVAVAAGDTHSLALKSDGTVVGWGENDRGQLNVPAELSGGSVILVAAGYGKQSLAVKRDGTVVGWGENGAGQVNIPPDLTDVVQVAGGGLFSMALRPDGTVVTWGDLGDLQELKPPAGLDKVVSIAAGVDHALALKADGTVVSWGYPWVAGPPEGLSNVIAIAAGSGFSLALKDNGKVVGWGRIYDAHYSELPAVYWKVIGDGSPPAGLSNVVAIAAGRFHALALTAPSSVLGVDWEAQITGTLYRQMQAQSVGSTGGRPTQFSAIGLPAGLSLDPDSGIVSGTPTEGGTFFVRVITVNDTGQTSRILPFKMVIPFRYAPVIKRVVGNSNRVTIERNAANGEEIQNFRIVGLEGVELFLGGRQIYEGDYLSAAEGLAGLDFVLDPEATEHSIAAQSAFTVELQNTGPATGALSLDAGTGPPTFRFSFQSFAANEGAYFDVDPRPGSENRCYAGLVEVRLDGDLTGYSAGTEWKVKLKLGDLTNLPEAERALAGEDYLYFAQSGMDELEITITGNNRQEIYILLKDDQNAELNEHFGLQLLEPATGPGVVVDATALNADFTIIDDDSETDDTEQINPGARPAAGGTLTVSTHLGTGMAVSGGCWKLTGEGLWHESGAALSGVVPGTYTVEFGAMPGYITPGRVKVTVSTSTPLVNVNYPKSSDFATLPRHSLKVSPESGTWPLGAAWHIVGLDLPWQDAGATVSNLPEGDYRIEFQAVSSYESPASVSAALRADTVLTTDYTLLPANAPAVVNSAALDPGQLGAFLGQVRTELGLCSGVVVRPTVVLTAAHGIFDAQKLRFTSQVEWAFQAYRDVFERKTLVPRGRAVFGSGYAAQYRKFKSLDKRAGLDPTESTVRTYDLDVGVLYFDQTLAERPGRGGKAGYLVQRESDGRWLGGSQPKLILGYPVEGNPLTDRGKLYGTAINDAALDHVEDPDIHRRHEVFASAALGSFPGNSGGPLLVQHSSTDPRYFPAGVVVGRRDAGQTLVRGIDNAVAHLIRYAEVLSDPAVAKVDRGLVGVEDPDQALQPPMLRRGSGNTFTVEHDASADGYAFDHFRITGIDGVELRAPDGRALAAGDFITTTEGLAGLLFTPLTGAVEQIVRLQGTIGTTARASSAGVVGINLAPGDGAPVFRFHRKDYSVGEADFLDLDPGLAQNLQQAVRLEVRLDGNLASYGPGSWSVDLNLRELLAGDPRPKATLVPGDQVQSPDCLWFAESSLQTLTLTMSSNEVREVIVQLYDDLNSEGDEFFEVVLSNPTGNGATVDDTMQVASVLIMDDEQALDDPNQTAPGTPPAGTGAILVRSMLRGTAPQEGGLWRLRGETVWHESRETVTGIAPGRQVVEFGPVPGYFTPSPFSVAVTVGKTSDVLVGYQSATPAEVFGLQVVAPAGQSWPVSGRWRVQGYPEWLSAGSTLDGLAQGAYVVEFQPVDGYLTPAPQVVSLAESTVLTVGYEARGAAQPQPVSLAGSDFAFIGQVRTADKASTGTVVHPNVVLTTASAIFDDTRLSFAENVDWLFQAEQSANEAPETRNSKSEKPRGSKVFGNGYSSAFEEASNAEVGQTPSVNTQNLDVAALFFTQPEGGGGAAGRNGSGGYLVDDGATHAWLTNNTATRERKILGYEAGRPRGGSLSLHTAQSAPATAALSLVSDTSVGGLGTDHQVFESQVPWFAGANGAPLLVLHSIGSVPTWFPAGMVVGVSAGKTRVRGIDNAVAYLIRRAEALSDPGGDITGQAKVYVPVSTAGVTRSLALSVAFEPAEVAASGQWRIANWSPAMNWKLYDDDFFVDEGMNYTVELGDISGYQLTGTQTDERPDTSEVIVTATYARVGSPLDTWAQDHGISLSAPEYADHTKEPYKRLLKRFAFAPNDSEASAAHKEPAVGSRLRESGQDYACFTYRRRKGGTPSEDATKTEYTADGITYHLDVTGNLGSGWSSGTGQLEGQPNPVDNADGTETVTVKWKTPLPAQGARGFFRVIVSGQ